MKSFRSSEPVQVVRYAVADFQSGDWIAAEYIRPMPATEGWHQVKLTALGTYGAFAYVPNRRIRRHG